MCGKSIESRANAQNAPLKRHYANYKNTEEIRRSNSESLELYKRRKKYVRRQPNNSQSLAYGEYSHGVRDTDGGVVAVGNPELVHELRFEFESRT